MGMVSVVKKHVRGKADKHIADKPFITGPLSLGFSCITVMGYSTSNDERHTKENYVGLTCLVKGIPIYQLGVLFLKI